MSAIGNATDVPFTPQINPTSENEEPLATVLDKWVQEGTPSEQREEAKTRIETCISNQEIVLNLYGLDLNSLPDIFKREELSHVKTFNVDPQYAEQIKESVQDDQPRFHVIRSEYDIQELIDNDRRETGRYW